MKKLITIISIVATFSLLANAEETTSPNGGQIFKKCAACHGKDASKSALGKSKIIKNMTKEELETAIKGYQKGTYGGAMKGLMKGQVINLKDEDINAVIKYIKELK